MVSSGRFKLHYAWVVLFAACLLNIASSVAFIAGLPVILTTCLGIPLALALPRHGKKPPAAGSKAVMTPAPVAG